MENKNKHGGYREGSGRKKTGRCIPVAVRISEESKEILDKQPNKNQFVDNLIKNSAK